MVQIELTHPVDCLCDFTYDFYWQHKGKRLDPDSIIPHQAGTDVTYRDLVNSLKKGEDIHIIGDAGRRLGSSLGIDLMYFGGTGASIKTGSIFIEGNVGTRAGISMVSGVIYVKGKVDYPAGNIIEVSSDIEGFKKFISITDLLAREPDSVERILPPNTYDWKTLHINDGLIRDTIAARCRSDSGVIVSGDAGMSTGILMEKGSIRIDGDTGMNTGVLLNGGCVIAGTAGEFAGAYMRKGILIAGKCRGYLGANMKGGTIYSRGKAIARMHPLKDDDIKMLVRLLGISRIEAMMYKKYKPL